jgi:hypothetical protein
VIYQWLNQNFRKIDKLGPLPNSWPDPYVMSIFERKDAKPAL